MKILVILLALVAVPVLVGYFQTQKYDKDLKPVLEKEALEVMNAEGVDNPSVKMDHLHATLSGVTATEEEREEVRALVSEVGGPGAVVVSDRNNNLETYGSLHIERSGEYVSVNGNFNEGTWADTFSAPMEGVTLAKGSSYREEGFFRNPQLPELAASNPEVQKWMGDFLALPGARGIKVGAQSNEIRLYGKMTEKLQKRTLSGAAAAGLTVTPDFEIVPATPIDLNTSSVGNKIVASGTIPDDLEVGRYGFSPSEDLQLDPFTDAPAGVYESGFGEWHKDFYADRQARRGYTLSGDKLTLNGLATPFLVNGWKSSATALGLKPEVESLKVFPSPYHYDSYKLQSKVSEGDLAKIKAAFELNQVYFQSGSSEVQGAEVAKVDALAGILLEVGDKASYIIGGHADSTGDIEINRKLSKERAAAVLEGLAERGVNKALFEVTSFGSAEAKKVGGSASDRRVEILVK